MVATPRQIQQLSCRLDMGALQVCCSSVEKQPASNNKFRDVGNLGASGESAYGKDGYSVGD